LKFSATTGLVPSGTGRRPSASGHPARRNGGARPAGQAHSTNGGWRGRRSPVRGCRSTALRRLRQRKLELQVY
jgi:hypothetical protein